MFLSGHIVTDANRVVTVADLRFVAWGGRGHRKFQGGTENLKGALNLLI